MYRYVKNAIYFFFIVVVSPAFSLEAPSGENLFPSYQAISNPVISNQALSSQPIAVGSIADRGSMLDLTVQLNSASPTDLFLALYVPELIPDSLFLFTENGQVTPLSNELLPWKRDIDQINETALANIPTSLLPYGDYYFYLIQTPHDNTTSLENYNLWSTTLSLKPEIIETGDPEMPVVVINPDGNIVSLRVDSQTKNLTGISINTQDGQQSFLAINPQTGLPDSWYSDETMLVFNNVRLEEGLMDLGVVYPDGSTGYLHNLTMDKALLATKTSRSYAVKRGLWSGFVASLNLAEKVGTVMSAAACGASVIVTGGAAAAGIAGFVAPPVSGAFFTIAVSASGVAMSCTTALIGLAAMKAENTKTIDVNNAIKSAGLPQDILDCVSAGAPNSSKTIVIAKAMHCFKALSDASSIDYSNALLEHEKQINELQAKQPVSAMEKEPEFEVDFSKIKNIYVSAMFHTIQYDHNLYGTDVYDNPHNTLWISERYTAQPLVKLTTFYEDTKGSVDSWLDNGKLSITMNPSGYHITNLTFTEHREYQVPKDGSYDTTEFTVSGLVPLNNASESQLTYIVEGNDACQLMTYTRKDYGKKSASDKEIVLVNETNLTGCDEKSYVRIDFYNY